MQSTPVPPARSPSESSTWRDYAEKCLPLGVFVLVVTLWLAAEWNSQVPSPPPDSASLSAAQWRRTAHGWEDRRAWTLSAAVAPPTVSRSTPIHPLVLASLQIGGVLSLLAMRGGNARA